MDLLGQQTGTIAPLGQTTKAVFDARGSQIASVDMLGNRTTFTQDKVGNQAPPLIARPTAAPA